MELLAEAWVRGEAAMTPKTAAPVKAHPSIGHGLHKSWSVVLTAQLTGNVGE